MPANCVILAAENAGEDLLMSGFGSSGACESGKNCVSGREVEQIYVIQLSAPIIRRTRVVREAEVCRWR